MGNNNASVRIRSGSTLSPEKQQQYQELHDICCNYLEHFEFILESNAIVEDPRQVLAVLKSNCQTAREQISKLPTKPSRRRRYSSVVNPTNTSTNVRIDKHQDEKTNKQKIKKRKFRSRSASLNRWKTKE
eukprot:249800_1